MDVGFDFNVEKKMKKRKRKNRVPNGGGGITRQIGEQGGKEGNGPAWSHPQRKKTKFKSQPITTLSEPPALCSYRKFTRTEMV